MAKLFYDETDDITGYWQRRYVEWAKNPNWGVFDEKDKWFEARLGHLLPTPDAPVGKVLEVGCGSGMYSIPLLRRFETYYGIDTSRTALDLAAQYFKIDHGDMNRRRYFALVDRNEDWFSPGQPLFDCVVSITVLQHQPIPRRLAMIEAIKRLLKPGGCYVGLEWADAYSRAEDMPPMPEEDWRRTWLPLVIERDVPPEHPEWRSDNVWFGVMP